MTRTWYAVALGVALAPCTVRAQQPAPTDATYAVRLEDLQRRVNEINELTRERAAACATLAASPHVLLIDDDDVSQEPLALRVALDGREVFSSTPQGTPSADLRHMQVEIGAVSAGPHVLSIERQYRGRARSIFSYLSGYVITTRSRHAFDVGERAVLQIRAEHRDSTALSDAIQVTFRERRAASPAP